jgi:hypothetical protein
MAWKKAVVVIAIVCGGAFGRVAALGTNGVEEQGCWSEYADEVVAIVQDFESCMRSLSRFGSLGSEFCTLLYVQEAEWALADFIGCVFGSAFGIIG